MAKRPHWTTGEMLQQILGTAEMDDELLIGKRPTNIIATLKKKKVHKKYNNTTDTTADHR